MRRVAIALGFMAAFGLSAGCDDGGGQGLGGTGGGGGSGPTAVDGGVDFGAGGAPVIMPDVPGPPAPALGTQIDRQGRDGITMALADPWGLQSLYSFQYRDIYNRASDRTLWAEIFRPSFEFSLGVWDGIDGTCGNQWLAGPNVVPGRYAALATLLLDDVLLLDTAFTTCNEYLAVEQRMTGTGNPSDCGGRTPLVDTPDALMTMLARGPTGRNPDGTWQISDGISGDLDGTVSLTQFPFLLPSDIGTPGTSSGGVDPQQIYLTCADLAETRCNRVYNCWGRDYVPYRDVYGWKVYECIQFFTAECKGTASTTNGPHCPAGQQLDPIKLRACERAYSMATCPEVVSAGAGLLPACGDVCM